MFWRRRVEDDALGVKSIAQGDSRSASAFAGVGLGDPVQLLQRFRQDMVAELFEQGVDRLARCLMSHREHPVPPCGTL